MAGAFSCSPTAVLSSATLAQIKRVDTLPEASDPTAAKHPVSQEVNHPAATTHTRHDLLQKLVIDEKMYTSAVVTGSAAAPQCRCLCSCVLCVLQQQVESYTVPLI